MSLKGFVQGTIVRLFDGEEMNGLMFEDADYETKEKYMDDDMSLEMATYLRLEEHIRQFLDSQTHTADPDLDIQVSKDMGIIIELKKWNHYKIDIPKLDFTHEGENYSIHFHLVIEQENDEYQDYDAMGGLCLSVNSGYDGMDGYDN